MTMSGIGSGAAAACGDGCRWNDLLLGRDGSNGWQWNDWLLNYWLLEWDICDWWSDVDITVTFIGHPLAYVTEAFKVLLLLHVPLFTVIVFLHFLLFASLHECP